MVALLVLHIYLLILFFLLLAKISIKLIIMLFNVMSSKYIFLCPHLSCQSQCHCTNVNNRLQVVTRTPTQMATTTVGKQRAGSATSRRLTTHHRSATLPSPLRWCWYYCFTLTNPRLLEILLTNPSHILETY